MAPSTNPATTRRVLLAEDVESIAQLVIRTLEPEGFEIAIAKDGEECLRRVKTFRPDLILLDIMMPKVHGIEVLRQLKADAATRDIPVVVISAKSFRTERKRVAELGAEGFVAKPFSPRDLRATVHEVLGTTETARESMLTQPSLEGETFAPRLDAARGCLRFWGTRGSIPVSGPQCQQHGGNTTCLSFEYGDELLVFDAGSGIRDLGLALAAGKPRKIHLFITHTHWDHIQGFPFFAPAFIPGFEIVVHGPRGLNKDLEALLRGQLDPDYFPIQMENMDARLDFVYLEDGPLRVGDVEVSWEFAQHPSVTLCYKMDIGRRKVAFVPDNEIFQGYLGDPRALADDQQMLDTYKPLIDFLTGVDLLIHEAQYTPEEYRTTARFGHSSFTNACFLVKLAGVRRWIVVHHDPNHSDDFLNEKLNLTRQTLALLRHPIEVVNGYDGLADYLLPSY